MRIGVISDTHVGTLDELPDVVIATLSEVDIIVHAGDFTERAVLDGLMAMGKVRAVCGNMDSDEVRRVLPQQEKFVLGGRNIGIVHGSGAPWGMADRVRQRFDNMDIIIYGHSHVPDNRYVGGCLLFNPGPARNSYGIITIDDEIKAEIIKV